MTSKTPYLIFNLLKSLHKIIICLNNKHVVLLLVLQSVGIAQNHKEATANIPGFLDFVFATGQLWYG
nr:MAG TPA: hypothetical protein [Caudoviricetes sp.]